MAYGSEDLAPMLADFGEVVTFGAYATKGVLDIQTDVQDLGDRLPVLGTTISVTVAAASLPGIRKGSAITVAAIAYKVREARLTDDGTLLQLFLEVA